MPTHTNDYSMAIPTRLVYVLWSSTLGSNGTTDGVKKLNADEKNDWLGLESRERVPLGFFPSMEEDNERK